jgi:hypothetical protein
MANDITRKPGSGVAAVSGATTRFLEKVGQKVAPTGGFLKIGMDATMSRQPMWAETIPMMGEVVGIFAELKLMLGVAFFRGLNELKSLAWSDNAASIQKAMSAVQCEGGNTQIGRLLDLAIADATKLRAEGKNMAGLIYFGDAMEENAGGLYARARQLKDLGVRVDIFQEGNDARTSEAFAEIARITGGKHQPFTLANVRALREDLIATVAVRISTNPLALAAVRQDPRLRAKVQQLLLEKKLGG